MDKYRKMLTENLGINLHYYEEVDSTNNVAKKIEKWHHGQIIVAKSQTAGRGTYGRNFYSKKGCGIYMTIILDTKKWHFKHETLATHLAAVAATEAIAEITQKSPQIKWVNDLFYNRKKIGGILTEKVYQSSKLIIGIGINLSQKQQEFPEAIQNTAASLQLNPPIDNQAAAIIVRLYDLILQPNQLSDREVLKEYKNKLFMLGQQVYITRQNKELKVEIIDVDEAGRLIVLHANEKMILETGEVRIKV